MIFGILIIYMIPKNERISKSVTPYKMLYDMHIQYFKPNTL